MLSFCCACVNILYFVILVHNLGSWPWKCTAQPLTAAIVAVFFPWKSAFGGRSRIKMAPLAQLFSRVSTWPMEMPRSLPCQMEDCPMDSCNHTLLFLTHQTLYPVEVWLASVWFPHVLSCYWPDSLSFSTIGLLILGIRYQATVSAEALGDRVKFSEWRSAWTPLSRIALRKTP